MRQFYEQNRRAWDDRVRRRKWYIDTAAEKDFQHPLALVDPNRWLGGDVMGKRLLCLAAGGGRHSVLFAASGAQVTVVDLSPEMLALDRRLAAGRGLSIRTIEASMDRISMLAEASFDIVVQPVSTCYVPDVIAVYREVARVIAPGGLYTSHHKQPATLQAEDSPSTSRGYLMVEPYYRRGPLPPVAADSLHREAGTIEFLHRWEELLGGLCRSGFSIEDVAEPRHADPKARQGSFGHRSQFLPPFISIKARRTNALLEPKPPPAIWTPEVR